jgi:hypothetical protein
MTDPFKTFGVRFALFFRRGERRKIRFFKAKKITAYIIPQTAQNVKNNIEENLSQRVDFLPAARLFFGQFGDKKRAAARIERATAVCVGRAPGIIRTWVRG